MAVKKLLVKADAGAFELEVQPDYTISTVKQSLQQATGVDVIRQHILLDGRVLEDAQTLEACLQGEAGQLQMTVDHGLPGIERNGNAYQAVNYTAKDFKATEYKATEYKATEYTAQNYTAKEFTAPSYTAPNYSASN